MPGSPKGALRRVVLASMIGTSIEWYDFYLYSTAAALVFNRLFFPQYDPVIGTLLAFATYALGFIARPIGGWVFGHFGNRVSRKRLLIISLLIMGSATFLMGALPVYAQAGVWAPLLLIALRVIQGFAIGGEWGGAVLLVAEHGGAARRGLATSWPQVGVPIGNLLSAGLLAVMSAVMPDSEFIAWGWRLPFFLSAALVAVGWWVRVSVADSPMFRQALEEKAQAHPYPGLEVVKRFPRGLLIGAGLRIGENTGYFILTTFSLTYIVEAVHGSRALALNALLAGAAVEGFTMPAFAALSDRIGRRPVYAFGALGLALWAFAFFPLLGSGNPALIALAIVGGLVFHSAMYGPQAAFLCELFPTRMRYSGVSISYQFSSILAGAIAPIIALALFQHFHSFIPIACYVAGACAISVVAVLLARETKGIDLKNIA